VENIAGHSIVNATPNTYAAEFDTAMNRDDLLTRIEKSGFGAG
jgi:hypothetical protein